MLQRLEIRNIAIIDKVSVELGDGLNVLTGETGAGKSIIIDSLNAVLGMRVSRDLIRTGKDKAVVEAVFKIEWHKVSDLFEEFGLEWEEDGTLFISREFTASGRNTCRINGRITTVSVLKKVGQRLIDIHGQHDNQSLLRTEGHIELLDSFAGSKLNTLKKKYINHFRFYQTVREKLSNLLGDAGERERRIDILKFQINEIEQARLVEGEEEELRVQRDALINYETIMDVLASSYELLDSEDRLGACALDRINNSLSEFCTIEEFDERYAHLKKRLEAISFELDDIVSEIRGLRDGMEYNPLVLEQTNVRLDVINGLKKKYGNTLEEIFRYLKEASDELNEIINNEEIINKLNLEIKEEEKKLFEISKKLNDERIKAAGLLENKIGKEFSDLEMKNTKFKANIEFKDSKENGERKYNNNGLNKVEFLISTNKGEPLKPLSKIASGGEMSRIMLALKTILANIDDIPTMVFDEIDIGISGLAAQKVGEKLCYISKNHQVLSVTHLAQIACMADHNYYVDKELKSGDIRTTVVYLDAKGKKHEIARIIGGANISGITLKHAQEMIENAEQFKKK